MPTRTEELHRIMPPMAAFEWAQIIRRWRELELGGSDRCRSSGDLGPMSAISTEDPAQFSERFVLSLRILAKEV